MLVILGHDIFSALNIEIHFVCICSPLIRRQAKLEEAVNQRLEILESNLLQQIKSVNTNVNHTKGGLMTPKSKAIDQIQKQLEASHAQLKELASRHMLPTQAPVPEDKKEETKVLQGNYILCYMSLNTCGQQKIRPACITVKSAWGLLCP